VVVHLIDGAYELFRQFYGLRRFTRVKGSASRGVNPPYGAVVGVLQDCSSNYWSKTPRISASRQIT